jgi:uncharacterized protein YggT (Ycf19 family)
MISTNTLIVFILSLIFVYLIGMWVATREMKEVSDTLDKFYERAMREFTAGDLYITKMEIVAFRRGACKLKCFDKQAGRVLEFVEQRLAVTLK